MSSVSLRPLARADYPLLARWRRDREWLTWWGPSQTEDQLEEHYGARIDGRENTQTHVAVVGGREIGLVQTYRHIDEPEWDQQIGIEHAAGIDYGIGRSQDRGRGLGKAVLTVLIDEAFDAFTDCTCVVAAPKTANRASCGVLESLGFELVETKHLLHEWPAEGTSSIYQLSRSQWSGSAH